MTTMSIRDASGFVQLVREFLLAHAELVRLLEPSDPEGLGFAEVRALVGDDNDSVLYRLKERSHALFRTDGEHASSSVRREALFDLAVGSLFHEAMKLRENLYQREVYAPRVARLRAGADESADDADELFAEFERILARSRARLGEVVSEVRILLAQSRDQLRRLLIERAGDRVVTRCLIRRRDAVDAAFPEGLEGLLAAMHGDVGTGLVEAARSLLESAYFVDAVAVLEEASRPGVPVRPEIECLERYAAGMQAFLDGDYGTSLSSLEAWVEGGGAVRERDFARLAAAATSRLDRLVEDDETGAAFATRAKQLQVRLEAATG